MYSFIILKKYAQVKTNILDKAAYYKALLLTVLYNSTSLIHAY